MKIGQKIYTIYGWVVVLGKRYSALSNSVSFYGYDESGSEFDITNDMIRPAPVESIVSKDPADELTHRMLARAIGVRRGQKGEVGPIGPRGIQGLKGDKGDKGDAGKDGKDGKDGNRGVQGERGKDGKKGEKGDKGTAGKDGKDGMDGLNGKDGRDGLNGLNGGGGIHKIDDADDVRIASPTSGQALTYNATTKKWENGTVSGASHDEVTISGEDFLSLTGQAITANPIDLDNLSATGTPSFTTFLRGDNTWATPSSSGGIVRTITTSSGAFTAGGSAGTDYVYLIAGAHAVALPTAVSNTNRYTFKNNHSSAITITPDGVETVEGASSIQVAPEDSVDLISNNANWFVI